MKKQLLILSTLFMVTSCNVTDNPSNSNLNYIEKNELLNALTSTYNVVASGEEKVTYPEEYSHYNTITPLTVNRDYAKIDENTPAIRELRNGILTTYFRNEEGYAVSQYYNADNTVSELELRYLGRNVLFNDLFANPFDFVDAEDILEGNKLNPVKASFVANKYIGIDATVKSATFTLENNKPTSLEFDFYEKVDAIYTYEMEEILVTTEYKLKLDFSYDVVGVAKLSPRPEADETLKNALKDSNNFTFYFSSTGTTDTLVTYVTNDLIYVHKDINAVGPIEGDIIYKKLAENNYDAYIYRSSNSKFNFEEFEIPFRSIVPSFERISPNLFIKQNDNVYELDQAASLNNLHYLVAPQYAVPAGQGSRGILTLDKNGNVSSLVATFNASTTYIITQLFKDYGTTSLPSWLDISDID